MTDKNDPTLTVGEAGEQNVISAIRRFAPSVVNGDDAAVLTPASFASRVVASTDALVQGQHFRFDWMTPYQVGQRAVAQNFADIQAMGARPVALLLSLGAPSDLRLEIVEQISQGIAFEASRFGTELVGGDVVRTSELVINITALGELAGPEPALELSKAVPGQTVIATGKLGYSGAGLSLLEYFGNRAAVPSDPDLQTLVDHFAVPHLEPIRGTMARAAGATAMTDISDGLVADLKTVASLSEVNIDLYEDAIKPDRLLEKAGRLLGVDPWKWVLSGGEDHALVGTTHCAVPCGFRPIGQVISTGHSESITVDTVAPKYAQGWSSL